MKLEDGGKVASISEKIIEMKEKLARVEDSKLFRAAALYTYSSKAYDASGEVGHSGASSVMATSIRAALIIYCQDIIKEEEAKLAALGVEITK